MLPQNINILLKNGAIKCISNNRNLYTTPIYSINQKWRKERGLPLNPNTHGVLTDGADYTFLDGRLTPYGVRQKNRILQQREIAQQVIDLTKEIDFAVERHKHLQLKEANYKKGVIANKLKPKGLELLKSKSK